MADSLTARIKRFAAFPEDIRRHFEWTYGIDWKSKLAKTDEEHRGRAIAQAERLTGVLTSAPKRFEKAREILRHSAGLGRLSARGLQQGLEDIAANERAWAAERGRRTPPRRPALARAAQAVARGSILPGLRAFVAAHGAVVRDYLNRRYPPDWRARVGSMEPEAQAIVLQHLAHGAQPWNLSREDEARASASRSRKGLEPLVLFGGAATGFLAAPLLDRWIQVRPLGRRAPPSALVAAALAGAALLTWDRYRPAARVAAGGAVGLGAGALAGALPGSS